MAQKSQIIDLRKSYIPGDPNSIHQNLVSTNKEDGEEQTLPIVPYEGYNFLPTSYGYRSYFGIAGELNFAALNSRVQHVVMFQLPNFASYFIALCEDGVWITNNSNGWTQAKVHTFNSNIFEEWTYCVIENVLYMYKAGMNVIYKTNYDLSYNLLIDEFTPSFLNMAGQRGIFKAGTRLGMWDSSNSISWSSNFDLADFTPSLETIAGNTTFNRVIGKILAVKNHGEGFIVYSTKSIVGVTLNLASNMLWEAHEVLANTGILHPLGIASGADGIEHYAYTTSGIVQIGGYSGANDAYQVKFIFPEVYDFLKEDRNPVILTMVHKRYLHFSTYSERYITASQSFSNITVDPSKTALTLAEGYWDGDITALPTQIDGNMLRTMFEQWSIGNQPTYSYDESCLV